LARKILLADDSVTAQNMGRRILSDAGYDVITVNNGSAALKKIAESKPDLILLDVYMPGYGGLEVCQRLREAPETARIPVLLTVGKLEPFKADEARRVRADGFIVKPFEASELLTALTRLEDKIVPPSQPAKASRFAKALARADDAASGKQFGDSETGWKSRLAIPPPHAKHRESPPKETPVAGASAREVAKPEEQKPAETEIRSGLEEAMLSSMPADVTAEEIAAIKAAAAAFNAPGEESSFGRQQVRHQAEEPIQEQVARPDIEASDVKAPNIMAEDLPTDFAVNAEDREVAASFASGFQPETETAPESILSVLQVESSASPAAESVSSDEVPAEAAPPPTATGTESPITAAPQIAVAATGKLADEEVTAALASLAPASGNGNEVATDRGTDTVKWDLAARDRVPVTMAATQEFNGRRWIAEPAALTDDEATLVLEQEMERAYAAFAAADAARMTFASSPGERDALPVAYTMVESFNNHETMPSASASPAPLTSTQESPAAEAEPGAASTSTSFAAINESAASEVRETAAYAAAASAGPTADTVMATETISQPSLLVESSENAPSAADPSGRQHESELAAAWANWRQVREQVVDSQLSRSQLDSQIAGTDAELKAHGGGAKPEFQPDGSSNKEDEEREIANIVDSVLADLKPKLMAEIARKMAKEPKKH
jgi:CheY-like chemotaxis protein